MSLRGIPTGALVAIAATALFLTVLTSGLLATSQTMQTTGEISAANVGVYTDSTCTMNCTSINWGTLSPGRSITRTVYVKNTGSIPIKLSMATANWSPANGNSYLTLAWNKAGTTLLPGASADATFTLTASSSAGAISNFGFNIIVTGTE